MTLLRRLIGRPSPRPTTASVMTAGIALMLLTNSLVAQRTTLHLNPVIDKLVERVVETRLPSVGKRIEPCGV